MTGKVGGGTRDLKGDGEGTTDRTEVRVGRTGGVEGSYGREGVGQGLGRKV